MGRMENIPGKNYDTRNALATGPFSRDCVILLHGNSGKHVWWNHTPCDFLSKHELRTRVLWQHKQSMLQAVRINLLVANVRYAGEHTQKTRFFPRFSWFFRSFYFRGMCQRRFWWWIDLAVLFENCSLYLFCTLHANYLFRVRFFSLTGPKNRRSFCVCRCFDAVSAVDAWMNNTKNMSLVLPDRPNSNGRDKKSNSKMNQRRTANEASNARRVNIEWIFITIYESLFAFTMDALQI